MTPADKLRELKEQGGRYYRLQVYGYGCPVYLLAVPGSDTRPLTEREALHYIETRMAAGVAS